MKNLLYIVGAVLVVIGVLGFFNNPILGIFEVNLLHNIIHLVTGVLAIWAGMQSGSAMRMFGYVLGIVYALVTILGFVLPGGDIWGLMMVNMADNILHLVLAVLFLYVGFGSRSENVPVIPV